MQKTLNELIQLANNTWQNQLTTVVIDNSNNLTVVYIQRMERISSTELKLIARDMTGEMVYAYIHPMQFHSINMR